MVLWTTSSELIEIHMTHLITSGHLVEIADYTVLTRAGFPVGYNRIKK